MSSLSYRDITSLPFSISSWWSKDATLSSDKFVSLKGECGLVKFFDNAIKLAVHNGNQVLNASSCQTEGFRDGTSTSLGEKDHSCAFIIMQQEVSEQGSAISANGDTNTLLENTIANLNVHIVKEKVEHFRNFPGRSKEHASSFGIGPVGAEISVYTNILLVEALKTFSN